MGIFSHFLHTRKSIYPYEYETIRQDSLDAGLEESKVAALDKWQDILSICESTKFNGA